MIIEGFILLSFVFLIWHWWSRNYWKRKRVFSEDAEFFFGHTRPVLFDKCTANDFFNNMYTKLKDKKLVGIYNIYEPQLVVLDMDLARNVLATDFNSFSIPGLSADPSTDPLLHFNPFVSKGELWKSRRAMVVANQTNAKMKDYIVLMRKVGHIMLDYIKRHSEEPVKVADICKNYTIDNICYIAYGYEPTAFTDQDNCFRKHACNNLFDKTIEQTAKFTQFMPRLCRLLKYRFISKEAHDFFVEMANNLWDFRKTNKTERNDYVDFLLRKSEEQSMDRLEFAGHLMTVYLDSVETSSTLLSFLLLEVANRDEVQERLREEIRAAGTKPEDFDFDKLNSLVYLNMVFNEINRMHPILQFFSRVCTSKTTLGDVEIDEGTKIFIPYHCVVNDPDIYPDPDVFRPERFAPDAIGPALKKSFIPFGDGPRQCPGMKYATLQIKLAVIFLLLNFKLIAEKKMKGNKVDEILQNILMRPSEDERIIFQPITD